MLDNDAEHTIIGWVDDRLRLVRHSDFMSSARCGVAIINRWMSNRH